MKVKYTLAALAATAVAAHAATVRTSNGTISDVDDANQAGPMWGQSITINIGADTSDISISQTVFLDEVSFQYSSSNSGGTPGDFLHVYDNLVTDASGAITSIGNLVTVSADANFGTLVANQQLTWDFGATAANAIDKATQYWYISASDTVAATTGNTGNLVGAGYELVTNNPYTGGETVRGNGSASGWDQDFEVVTQTIAIAPEPSSTALLGLGGMAMLLRRRK